MHIRCKSCHGTIWVEPPGPSEPVPSVRCKTCAQDYSVDGLERLRSSERRLAIDGRKIAETHGVDLPGAYSVLLGIMTAEEVLELGDSSSAACRTTTTAPAPPQPESRPAYDRAFQPAIEAGLLSVLEATRRGQRAAYVEAIAQRYGLAPSLAMDIADNRTSLLNCLRERESADSAKIVASVPQEPRRYFGWVAGGLAVGAMTLLIAYASTTASPKVVRTVVVLGAEVRLDDRGNVVRVAAPDPRTVLNGFCAIQTGSGAMAVIAVVPSKLGSRDARLGLFRESAQKGRVFMIEILENRAAGRWVAGDGVSPIVPRNAPPGALAEERATGGPG